MSRRPLRGFDPGRLRLARQVAGHSRAELARLTGVSRKSLSQWERGTTSPRPDHLARCASQLGVDVADFFVIADDDMFLADLRTQRGMLQSELAEILGVTPSRIGQVERAEVPLGEEVARRWADALHRTPTQVLDSYMRVRTRPAGS